MSTEPMGPDQTPDLGAGLSKFHFHSVGTVAANKKLTQKTIEVVLDEQFSYIDGEVTDNKKEVEETSTDYAGEKWKVKLDTTPTVMAHWLPLGCASRQTAPDVRRGETVMIFKYADTDQYWWMEMMQYKHIRRLETIVWSISNNAEEDVQDDPDSTYWVEWSTHRQVMRIHTSKSNGEPFVYDIEINAKEGRIVIKDDDDNYIFMDSAERRIKAHNKDDSFIDLDKRKIWINSKDEIKLTTDRYILNAKSSIDTTTKRYNETNNTYTMKTDVSTVNASDSITQKAINTITQTAGRTFAVRAGDYTMDASSSWKTTVTRAQFIGSISVTGNIKGSSYTGGHHGG